MLAALAVVSAQDHDPFARGQIRLAIVLGSTSAFDSNYIVGGGGVGYFVADGAELGVNAQFWFGGAPEVASVEPQVRYVLSFVPTVKPYVGGFYRRWFIADGYADFDAVGGRAGFFYVPEDGRSYLGFGAVYEQIVSACSGECAYVYPELYVSISL